jgi:hypothetical protein
MESEVVGGSNVPRQLQTGSKYWQNNEGRVSTQESERPEENEEVIESRSDDRVSLVRLVEEQAILISLHSSQAFMVISLMGLLAVEESSCEPQEYSILKPIYCSIFIDKLGYNAEDENQ